MASPLIDIITSANPQVRNRSLDSVCRTASLAELVAACADLDAFRRRSDNLYERVRALFFLYAIHRFHLPIKPGVRQRGLIPFRGFQHLLDRRFDEAIEAFSPRKRPTGPGDPLSSALAAAYQRLAFQTLADQVRRSVRSVRGNQWMFRMGHPADHPLRSGPNCCGATPMAAIRSCASARRCAWTSATAAGATSFFWAWIFPKARGC